MSDKMTTTKYNYGTAICSAFEYLLEKYPEVWIKWVSMEVEKRVKEEL